MAKLFFPLFFIVFFLPSLSPLLIAQDIEGYDLIINDDFRNNKNRWESNSKKEKFTIEGGRLVYENEKKGKDYRGSCGIIIPLEKEDNYIIDISLSYLSERCPYQLVYTKPYYRYCGLNIGNETTNMAFCVGTINYLKDKKYCDPGFYINGEVAGASYAIQEWTKNTFVKEGSAPNKLKIIKDSNTISFYVNGQLVKSSDAISLSIKNTLTLCTNKGSKMSVEYLKVYKKKGE